MNVPSEEEIRPGRRLPIRYAPSLARRLSVTPFSRLLFRFTRRSLLRLLDNLRTWLWWLLGAYHAGLPSESAQGRPYCLCSSLQDLPDTGFRLLNSFLPHCHGYLSLLHWRSVGRVVARRGGEAVVGCRSGLLVGAGRFERPTPCAQGRCATRLRYAPTFEDFFILKHFLTRRAPRRGQKLPKTGPTVSKPCQNPISWASPCQNSGCSNSPAGSASAEPPASSATSSVSTS